jgi:heat shock protein HslJ
MKYKLLALTLLMALLVAVFPAFAQDNTASTVQFNGVGFSFDSTLATNVSITQYAGDATDLEQPGGPEARHTQFNLFTEQPAPESFFDAPVGIRVYRTADLAAYEGSMVQVTALQDLLANRPDLAAYMTVDAENSSSNALPFLPVAPASQVIRARAQFVDAPTISGISYVTVYRQDVSPFINNEFWYAFQGISTDGLYYVSAVMRLTVPDFPAELPADFDYEAFTATFTDYLTESVANLNAPAPEAFTPALTALDTLVQTFTFVPAVSVVETPVAGATSTDPTLGGLAGKVWTLVSYGPADAPIAAVVGVLVTAFFSEEGITGHGGCNGYSGPFQYNQGTITFGPITSTLMACEPAEITTQESAYLAALQAASTYTITGDTLQIVYDGGVLTYTAGTATPIVPTLPPGATASDPTLGGLAGTVWTLVSYGPADAPIPAVAGAPVTAVFAGEGVSGSAGCNTYSGPFAYSQNNITFGAMVSTLLACESQEVSTQEAAYLAALPSATSFTVANGTLQIVYDGGVLTFTSAS